MADESTGEPAATNRAQTVPTDAAPAPQRKLWRVGTLTYAFGGLVILFSWLLWGDFAWSMRDRAVAPVVQMLVKKYGASDTVMGLLLSSLPLGISAILGPIISYRSDRHRGRWGRRIPYILVATPVAALAMAGLAFSRPVADMVRSILGSQRLAGVNLTLIVFGVFWTCFEFAAITAGAVFGALINDVVPNSLLGRFYGLFRVLSLLAGILFNYWLIGQAEEHSQWLFGSIAILYGVGVMMMCLMVKEGQYPPPPDVKPGERKSVFAVTKAYFKECFSKPYYLWVFLGLTFGGISFWPINNYSVPFANSMGVNMEMYGKYTALSYVISLCLAYFLGMLVDRFHALRVSIVALLLYAIAMMAGTLLRDRAGALRRRLRGALRSFRRLLHHLRLVGATAVAAFDFRAVQLGGGPCRRGHRHGDEPGHRPHPGLERPSVPLQLRHGFGHRRVRRDIAANRPHPVHALRRAEKLCCAGMRPKARQSSPGAPGVSARPAWHLRGRGGILRRTRGNIPRRSGFPRRGPPWFLQGDEVGQCAAGERIRDGASPDGLGPPAGGP